MKELTRRTYEERILAVDQYIRDNLDGKLELSHLAGIACFSQYHFHRIFKAFTGETLREYIRRLKLERAARSLKHSGRKILAIAEEAGYENPESFSRAFQQNFGISPSAFRESARLSVAMNLARQAEMQQNHTPLEVGLEQCEARTVAFMRHTGAYPEVGDTWNALMQWAFRTGVFNQVIALIGVSFDDPDITAAERLRYDACLHIPKPVPVEGDVGIRILPGGLFARTRHVGPYTGLHQAYAKLFGEWLPDSGYEPLDSPCFEIYRNSLMNSAPEDLVTDIFLPLSVPAGQSGAGFS